MNSMRQKKKVDTLLDKKPRRKTSVSNNLTNYNNPNPFTIKQLDKKH